MPLEVTRDLYGQNFGENQATPGSTPARQVPVNWTKYLGLLHNKRDCVSPRNPLDL